MGLDYIPEWLVMYLYVYIYVYMVIIAIVSHKEEIYKWLRIP